MKLDNIVNKLVLDNNLTVTYQLFSKENAFFEYTLDRKYIKKLKDFFFFKYVYTIYTYKQIEIYEIVQKWELSDWINKKICEGICLWVCECVSMWAFECMFVCVKERERER